MLTLIITLSLIGCLLVFCEIYIPGGILGTLGALCFLGAVVAAYVEYGFGVGNILLVCLTVLSLCGLAAGLHFFPNTSLGKRFQLNTTIHSPTEHPDFTSLVGSRGVAVSSLRPAGVAMIDDTRYDVVSQGGLITSGTNIEVIHAEGSKIIVRTAADQQADKVS